MKRNVVIAGAGGRDFFNFLVYFKNNPIYNVVAFTAAQIPGIEKRKFPKELAGKHYRKDIPIFPESELASIIKKFKVDEVVLAYSDLSHEEVMHKASIVLAAGANFILLGPNDTMLKSKKKVIAVVAVRTGAGKSPTSRRIIEILKSYGKSVVVIRHPMPYGNLKEQVCQRFATLEDLKKNKCSIEEMEEYAPHVANGTVVYAGVDYEKILKAAEKEANVILFDGGNNDLPFIRPDLWITVADARRPGHEVSYYPGEANFRAADAIIVNKIDTARPEDIEVVIDNASRFNPKAYLIRGVLSVTLENPEKIAGKKVLVVEDGPTLTHGGLSSGAGTIVVERYGGHLVNPRQSAVGSLKKIYEQYPHIGAALPAMGYSHHQLSELEQTINETHADFVVFGTPVDLSKFLKLNKPSLRVRYELKEIGEPNLEQVMKKARII